MIVDDYGTGRPASADALVGLLTKTPSHGSDSLASRYRATFVGVAVGNALGRPAEGSFADLVRFQFPDGIRDISKHEKYKPWDDDLAQTALLAEALIDSEHLTVTDLARRLRAWAKSNGRGMGGLTAAVLGATSQVPLEKAAEYVWRMSGRNAAGNGAVMRCSPVALRWWIDPARLVDETYTSAVFSHFDPRCCWSAVAVNVAIASLLRDVPITIPELADALAADGAPNSVVEAVRQAASANLDDFELDDSNSKGYTLKTMQVGLWCLDCSMDFEEALVNVVCAAGDADTNGAVAGAMLGARYGMEHIPQRWADQIANRERLNEMADALLDAVG